MKNKNLIIIVAILTLVILGIWFLINFVKPPSQTNTALANPASVNCAEKGGTLTIETKADGGQFGLCTFEDNMQCEEWALYRGDCPVGGVKITGYDNPQQVYCAISGGQTEAVENATCTFPNGAICSVDGYYQGVCGPNISSRS